MKDRLKNGARMLGALWHSGKKCKEGWLPGCSCGSGQTQFCIVKLQWVALAQKEGRAIEPDLMIVEAMTATELEETGMTIILDNGLRIGPSGSISVKEAARLAYEPEAIPAVLQVLKSFPGARVVPHG